MSTIMKTELSEKNPWWIPKERQLELVHFTKQFYDWVQEYNEYDIASVNVYSEKVTTSDIADRTAKTAIKKAEYAKKIDMVNQSARKAVYRIVPWIEFDKRCTLVDKLLEGIIDGKKYYALDISDIISEHNYYLIYRCYFWHLDKERG